MIPLLRAKDRPSRAVELLAEADRRALADPDAVDAHHPLLPLARLAALRRQIEAELAPAGRDGSARAVRVLAQTTKVAGAPTSSRTRRHFQKR